MPIKIPQQTKTWSQLNQGDLLGTLFASRNIDLNTPGILKLAQRTRYVGRSTSGNFTNVNTIVFGNFNSTFFQYWIVSGGGSMYTLNQDLTGFAVDALANTPGTVAGSDACTWNGNLYVTKSARVAKLAAGTWTTNWSSADFTTIDSNMWHPIEPNVTNANLLIGDKNLVKRCISDGTIDTALTLPTQYKVIWIRRGTRENYIGLDSVNGGSGAIAIWDGLDTTLAANSLIPIRARTPLSAVLDVDGVLKVFQSDGRLMRFNGSGFQAIAELPPFRDYTLKSIRWGGTLSVSVKSFPRGMDIIDGKIHVAIESITDTSDSLIMPNFHGGVWVYDQDNKAFYHKNTVSNSNTVTDFGASTGATLMSAIYPIVQSLGSESIPSNLVGSDLLIGGEVYGDTFSTVYRTIASATTGENRGSFTTNRIECGSVTQDTVAIWCKYQGLVTATDKILFKYRVAYRDPVVLYQGGAGITWTSTTTFTTTDVNAALAVVGDEVTVLTGNGAGCTAHITTIGLVSTTYTITLDEAITGVANTNTAYVLVDNWKKLTPTITYLDTNQQKKVTFTTVNKTWFQVKCELRGEGGVVGIQELQIVTHNNLPIE